MYEIWLDDELICCDDWMPRVQAAWDRASRNRDAAQRGGIVRLLLNGQEIARRKASTGTSNPWPDGESITQRDVAKALMTLVRHLGISDKDVADTMTAQGLPTTRAALRSAHSINNGERRHVTSAELCVMINAIATIVRES